MEKKTTVDDCITRIGCLVGDAEAAERELETRLDNVLDDEIVEDCKKDLTDVSSNLTIRLSNLETRIAAHVERLDSLTRRLQLSDPRQIIAVAAKE